MMCILAIGGIRYVLQVGEVLPSLKFNKKYPKIIARDQQENKQTNLFKSFFFHFPGSKCDE